MRGALKTKARSVVKDKYDFLPQKSKPQGAEGEVDGDDDDEEISDEQKKKDKKYIHGKIELLISAGRWAHAVKVSACHHITGMQ